MAGVYISWPFCAQKCTFCNFASGVQTRDLEVLYALALTAEIAAHEWAWNPETVYLGGGTPSSMRGETLASVLMGIPGSPWREATIEAAPGTITPEKIAEWKAAGINRVSLGVQSFVKSELARTGRRHDAGTVEREIGLLREFGISNINIDLIAGLPGQNEAAWRESLAWIKRLQPPHVSVYMFEVDEDSRLGQEILNGGVRYGAADMPDDAAIACFYEIAVDELARLGIARYEISNFASAGFESQHNMKYWTREPYVGFGADAHSFDGARRWQNIETARQYTARFHAGESLRANCEDAVPQEEKFFVGLRLMNGIELDESDWVRFGPALDRLFDLGMIEKCGGRVRLTARGVMVSNEVFEEFIAA